MVRQHSYILFFALFCCSCSTTSKVEPAATRPSRPVSPETKPVEQSIDAKAARLPRTVGIRAEKTENDNVNKPCEMLTWSFATSDAAELTQYQPPQCTYPGTYPAQAVSPSEARVLLPTGGWNEFYVVAASQLMAFLGGKRGPSQTFEPPVIEGCGQRWSPVQWLDDCAFLFEVGICDVDEAFIKNFCTDELSQITTRQRSRAGDLQIRSSISHDYLLIRRGEQWQIASREDVAESGFDQAQPIDVGKTQEVHDNNFRVERLPDGKLKVIWISAGQ